MTHVVLPHFLQGYDKSHLTSDDGDVFLVKALKHPIEDLVDVIIIGLYGLNGSSQAKLFCLESV